MTANPQTNSRQRIITGAYNYAAFDKSDPFALRRALSHIKNGVATLNNGKDNPGYYEAEEYPEHREFTNAEGKKVKYTVPAFKNIARP